MGRLYLIQLDGRIYSCKHCRSHLANSDELLSRVIASFSSCFFPLLFWDFVCGLLLLPFLMVYYHMVFCVTRFWWVLCGLTANSECHLFLFLHCQTCLKL
jgi:hypothetical protein